MKNKTVIRKKIESGGFTSIHNSIIKDKRLSPNGFRLLVSILSDSDDKFNLSQTLYCKRLGIEKTTFFNAINNLEDCGYLKKTITKGKKLYHYTISEYGNLNTSTTETKADLNLVESTNQTTPIQLEKNENINISELSADFLEYYYSLEKLLSYTNFQDFIYDCLHVHKIRTVIELKKKVNEFLLPIYKENLALAKDPDKHPKALIDFKAWLKTEIFGNHNLSSNAKSKWAHLSLVKYGKKFKTDHETMMSDYYENPKD